MRLQNAFQNIVFDATKVAWIKTLLLKFLRELVCRNLLSGGGQARSFRPDPETGRNWTQVPRHQVIGVGRGRGQAVFNQIPYNPAKIRLNSG